MAHSVSNRRTSRIHHRRFYHWRMCRFEPLEVRQVLSASSVLAGLENMWLQPLYSASGNQMAGPVGMTPAQIRQAYIFNGTTFNSPFSAGTSLKVGQLVSGPNIPAGTTIKGITGNQLTLSAGASGSGLNPTIFGSSVNLTTTSGSDIATVSSTTGLAIGQTIGGSNVPTNTTVYGILDSSTILLSAQASVTTAVQPTVIGVKANLQTTSGKQTASVATSLAVPADGKGITIAIYDAGNDPSIIADANAFSLQFDLPLFNNAGGPTLKVVNQNGSSNPAYLPADDPFVSVETSLDVEWAHAIAPKANILLVESDNIFNGINYARSVPNVSVVSISYSFGVNFVPGVNDTTEFLGETTADRLFTTPAGHQGLSFTVSAGDGGGPAEWPSASPNVLSVGGTKLTLTKTNNYASEVVWNEGLNGGGGGGGLSGVIFFDQNGFELSNASPFPLEPAPNFQSGLGFKTRATPDVSLNADPVTGYAVYDSFAFGAATPWETIGGTSAAAPQWAALVAIVDQGRALLGKSSLANVQSVVYKLPAADFHDITIGNNDAIGLGLGITGNAAKPGYDLASGRGTPIANLVIRDLVAFNGSTVVTQPTSTFSSSLLGSPLILTMPNSVGAASGSSYFLAGHLPLGINNLSVGLSVDAAAQPDIAAIQPENSASQGQDKPMHTTLHSVFASEIQEHSKLRRHHVVNDSGATQTESLERFFAEI